MHVSSFSERFMAQFMHTVPSGCFSSLVLMLICIISPARNTEWSGNRKRDGQATLGQNRRFLQRVISGWTAPLPEFIVSKTDLKIIDVIDLRGYSILLALNISETPITIKLKTQSL